MTTKARCSSSDRGVTHWRTTAMLRRRHRSGDGSRETAQPTAARSSSVIRKAAESTSTPGPMVELTATDLM